MRGQGKNALGMAGWLIVAIACMAAIGMSGGVDGKSPPPDFSKFGQMFDVKDRADKPSPKRTKKPRPADEPPPMTCDGDQCWWTEQGRPAR